MKTVLYVYLVLLLLGCFSKTAKIAENRVIDVDINKIILHHVSLTGILTAVDISCEDFERAFVGNMKKDTITNEDEIALLKLYLTDLESIDSLHLKSIDTRVKLFLISHSDTLMYCFNDGILYSNGRYYRTPKELIYYIEQLQE